MQKFILSIILTFMTDAFMMAQGRLCINEVMQSNVDFLMVGHDFPDSWVELYNGGNDRISIKNYRLGPTKVVGESYKITSEDVFIEPGGYLLVYCDKTDAPMHCYFNLESDEGKVFLFHDKWQAIDSIHYESMPAPNIAYGRISDGADQWGYELTATPGASNRGDFCSTVLPAPLFSNEGHVMTNGAENVKISMPDGLPEDCRIYITTDGSEPNWTSLSDTLVTLTIDKNTVIRAKLLSRHAQPIRSTTHSYIFHPRETTLPIISIATTSDYLYSSQEGIFSNDSTDGKPNYSYDWRRPANFEYFNTKDKETIFNQPGEMGTSGNATRKYAQKSIRCYAKKRFGKKNFKGQFWRDKPDVKKVKSFILRNGGNNCLTSRIDDAFIQKMFGIHLDSIDYQAYEPAIVYINGLYKGIYGMRERSNDDYVSTNYNIDSEDIEMATQANYRRDDIYSTPLFNSFNKFYHGEDVTYMEMSEEMNIANFMNTFIAECYASNTDFPENNISMWRPKDENGRWNWILKDLDFISINDYTWNSFKYLLGTSDPQDQEYELSNNTLKRTCCFLYEKMMSYPEFRNRFIGTYATYLGDFLRPDICLPVIYEMDNEIIDEIAPTFAAYDNMSTPKNHNTRIQRLCNYVTNRSAVIYSQMADFFSLGNVVPITVSIDTLTEFENGGNIIKIGNVPLRTGSFDGAWFTSFPLSLETDAEDAVWIMTTTHSNGEVSTEVFNTPQIEPDLTTFSADDSVAFVVTTVSALSGVMTLPAGKPTFSAKIFDATGRPVSTPQKGLNIILYSDGPRKKVIK